MEEHKIEFPHKVQPGDWIISPNGLKVVGEHHAITCDQRSAWQQTYISRDKEGKPQAFEFKCTAHKENFWLAVPTPEILALQD